VTLRSQARAVGESPCYLVRPMLSAPAPDLLLASRCRKKKKKKKTAHASNARIGTAHYQFKIQKITFFFNLTVLAK